MPWLDTYTGTWTRREAAHLLRRVSFGANSTQLNTAVSDGLLATINKVFASRPLPDPPVDQTTGEVWVTGEHYDLKKGDNYYNQSTRAWIVGLMLEDSPSIREKLTLFWMNHFATESVIVSQAIFTYRLLSFLRENSLGNFKELVRQVTKEQAMLIYLNGNTNTKGNANENYGRELQELFTIGKGPEAAAGDYTNYSEQDVKAAARVLTGWRVDRTTGQTVFQSRQHDTGDKQFSHCYQNTVIKGRADANAGETELEDLLTLILAQPATATYIVGKLYRWFVNSDLNEDVVQHIITPLATELSANWQVEPILRKLLSCDHFYDNAMIGSQLRSPADLVIGSLRTFTTYTIPSTSAFAERFRFLQMAVNAMAAQQMVLLDPPNVAGWQAYYQTPGYYTEWFSSATLPLRNAYTDTLPTQMRIGTTRSYLLDTLEFIKTLQSPDSSLDMIKEINELFFALPFAEATVMKLAEDVLMDGGRYYEWSTVWNDYLTNPNAANKQKARTSLDRLFVYLFRMAEFQLF